MNEALRPIISWKKKMKFLFLLSLICYFHIDSIGQTKKIKGRIISEDLESLPGTWIENADTTLIAQTDMNGSFEIEIPKEQYKLMFRNIGMEWTVIELNDNCNIIEVIMQLDGNDCFATLKKIDRIRKKRFKKLSNLYQTAYNKGLFTLPKPCFKQIFIPYYIK